MRKVNGTHIYIVSFSDGVIKIGRTSNFKKRLVNLRYGGNQRGATLEQTWCYDTAGSAVEAEWYLRRYGRMTHERAFGIEYFRGEFDEFLDGARKNLILHGLHEPLDVPS